MCVGAMCKTSLFRLRRFVRITLTNVRSLSRAYRISMLSVERVIGEFRITIRTWRRGCLVCCGDKFSVLHNLAKTISMMNKQNATRFFECDASQQFCVLVDNKMFLVQYIVMCCESFVCSFCCSSWSSSIQHLSCFLWKTSMVWWRHLVFIMAAISCILLVHFVPLVKISRCKLEKSIAPLNYWSHGSCDEHVALGFSLQIKTPIHRNWIFCAAQVMCFV